MRTIGKWIFVIIVAWGMGISVATITDPPLVWQPYHLAAMLLAIVGMIVFIVRNAGMQRRAKAKRASRPPTS